MIKLSREMNIEKEYSEDFLCHPNVGQGFLMFLYRDSTKSSIAQEGRLANSP